MLKYVLTLAALTILVVLAAMGVVRYIEVSYSVQAAYLSANVVGPVALAILGLVFGLLDDWRCRLVVAKMHVVG